jgi:hypothetical protein
MLVVTACQARAAERADPGAGLPGGAAGIRLWRQARGEVSRLRTALAPPEPYRMTVTLLLHQPALSVKMRARGAVAVRPPRQDGTPGALRMILLGPGGTTALDMWVCGELYRFQVPALDLVKRGDEHTPGTELRGLPVSFLRWWFLAPLSGELLAHSDADPRGRRYVLRDGEQIVHATVEQNADVGHGLELVRLSRGEERTDVETMWVQRRACGSVRYRQQSTGIDIRVRCEERVAEAAPAAAFADPDDPAAPCGGDR